MKTYFTVFIFLLLCSCEDYKPKLKYPVVYIDTSRIKHARWSDYVKTIIVKDRNGDSIQLFTQRGWCSRFTDSVYRNCKIGDTIK